MSTHKVGVIGASGYGGSELLRLLLNHPHFQVTLATAHQHAGKHITEVHPNMRGFYDLHFEDSTFKPEWNQLDAIFLAVPHGRSMPLMSNLDPKIPVVDLTGDFRLRDKQIFEDAYKRKHTCFEHQNQFVYGLTEVYRKSIASTKRVANPGCFATATSLGLYPLINDGLISGKIIVDAKTGSSGSGSNPKTGTHHPRRSNSLYSYKPFTHQHVPEILQLLQEQAPSWDGRLVFQTHSAPMVRGIFASIYVTLKQDFSAEHIRKSFEKAYEKSPFVRLVDGSPDVNWVKTTNFADIGWFQRGQDLNVFVAIDNLVKGASGQAIQNMNLMFGYEEQTGILLPGSNP